MIDLGSFKLHPSNQQLKIRRALLNWYRRNARDLPWRLHPSPYATWVSEVMLQQTQVATVTPFYFRFMREFPALKNLAEANLERVLELWSGLGYYRRARNLHAAARVVVTKFNGKLPSDYRQIRTLPGVGDYTARAILSIAFQQPLAVMDGNVARVVARLKALKGNINLPRFRVAVEREMRLLLSQRAPGDFNQAMMEFGQRVCLPRAPRCAICPCRKWCEGFRREMPESFPAPRPRRAAELHYLAAAIVRRGPQVALVRGLDNGLLVGLWNFPSSFGTNHQEALRNLESKLNSLFAKPPVIGAYKAEVRHTITHRSIRVRLYTVDAGHPAPKTGVKWFKAHDLDRLAISQLARKISIQLDFQV